MFVKDLDPSENLNTVAELLSLYEDNRVSYWNGKLLDLPFSSSFNSLNQTNTTFTHQSKIITGTPKMWNLIGQKQEEKEATEEHCLKQ